VHELLREDPEVKAAVIERLGEGVLDEDGAIDRTEVGKIVFSDRSALMWLEQLLHPRVAARYLRWREELAALPEPPAVVVVTASPEARVARRIGPLREREQRLVPEEEKVKRADFVYLNDGPPAELDEFVSGVMATLSECPSRQSTPGP
jgi:dephospho-CoA kinase